MGKVSHFDAEFGFINKILVTKNTHAPNPIVSCMNNLIT